MQRRLGALASLCFFFVACSDPSAGPVDAAPALDTGIDGGIDGGSATDAGADAASPATDAAVDGGPCDEAHADEDGDGTRSITCGGTDCDDHDALRFPTNPELCDAANRDEDCDTSTFGVRDADGDGYNDASCCNVAAGTMICGDDCDDTAAGRHPTANESCDGADQDCDGAIDEMVLLTIYRDVDGDLYGQLDMSMQACGLPSVGGWAFDFGDCDDMHAARHPGAPEACDGTIDDDCDGAVDEGCTCTTGSSQPCGTPDPADPRVILETGACQAGTQPCVGGMWGGCSGDIGPSPEVCSPAPPAIDEDCDGSVDERLLTTCFPDADGDGYAVVGATGRMQCGCSTTETSRDPAVEPDCDDTDRTIHPGATDACDGVDSNCDGYVEDQDGDHHTAIGAPCTGGTWPADDCDDAEPHVHPDQTCWHEHPECLRNGEVPCFSGVARRWVCGTPDATGACDLTQTVCSTAGCYTWDYDCSRTDERMPVVGSTCAATPPLGWSCSAPAICVPTGTNATCRDENGNTVPNIAGGPTSDSGTCGSRVSNWNECMFDCAAGPCTMTMSLMPSPLVHDMPCR